MPRCSLALDVLTRPPDLQDPVMTQPDTLMMIARKTYMGVNVPIYHFKQPDRLNPKQASPHADSARDAADRSPGGTCTLACVTLRRVRKA